MNWDRIEGSWKQVNGKVLKNWGELTENETDIRLAELIHRLGSFQKARGIRKEKEYRQFEEFDSAIHNVMNLKKSNSIKSLIFDRLIISH